MDITLAQCSVIVTDPDPALAFDRDTLGLQVRNDVTQGEFRWITVGEVRRKGYGDAHVPVTRRWSALR